MSTPTRWTLAGIAALSVAAHVFVLGMTAPELLYASPLLIQVAPGSVVRQWFDARRDGVTAIHVDGRVTGGDAQVDARLFEREPWGALREIRRVTATWPSEADCCDLTIERLPYAAGRRYALDLSVLPAAPQTRLSLRIDPVRGPGDLVLNGHPQSSNLRLDLGRVNDVRLKGAVRVPPAFLLAAFAAANVLVAVAVSALFSASNPRLS